MSALVTGIGVATSLIGAIPKLLPLIAIGLIATGNGKVLGEVAKNVLGSFKGILEGVGVVESEKDIEKRETENQINQMGFVSSQKDGKLLEGADLPTEAVDKATQGLEKNGLDKIADAAGKGDGVGVLLNSATSIVTESPGGRIIKSGIALVGGNTHAKEVGAKLANEGFTMSDGTNAEQHLADLYRQATADVNKDYGGFQPVATALTTLAQGKDKGFETKVNDRFSQLLAEDVKNGVMTYDVDKANNEILTQDIIDQTVEKNDLPLYAPENVEFITGELEKKGAEAPEGVDLKDAVTKAAFRASQAVDPLHGEHKFLGKYTNGDMQLEKQEKGKAFARELNKANIRINLGDATQSVSDETANRSSTTSLTEKAENIDQLLAVGESAARNAGAGMFVLPQGATKAGKNLAQQGLGNEKSANEKDANQKATKETGKQSQADDMSR